MRFFSFLFRTNLFGTKPGLPNEPTVAVTVGELENERGVMVLAVTGKYKMGAAGNVDADFIFERTEAAIRERSPKAVLVDMSTLEYEWGDMMDRVLDIGKGDIQTRGIPTAFVIGPKCAPALGTLIHGEDSTEPATTENNIFDDFEKAREWLMVNLKKK